MNLTALMAATMITTTGGMTPKALPHSFQIEEHEGYNVLSQPDGPSLGYSPQSGVDIIIVDGKAFKDLAHNGTLLPYEDWRLSAQERARDLASRLSVEEIAGLMLYSLHQPVPQTGKPVYGGKTLAESGADPSALTDEQIAFLRDDNVRAVLVTKVESPAVAARWNNRVQALVEGLGHGIPANNSSDPRNETATTDEFLAGAGGHISLWPRPIGMAAIMDPELVRRFGQIASREYRALGITTALSPPARLSATH